MRGPPDNSLRCPRGSVHAISIYRQSYPEVLAAGSHRSQDPAFIVLAVDDAVFLFDQSMRRRRAVF